MARINIDEKWKTDPRRKSLAKRVGGDRAADGMLCEITWLVMAHRGQPVPLKEFKFIENFADWIDCGLGEVVGDCVRISGADRYREFFEKQTENGKKPKLAKRSQTKPNKAKVSQTKPNKPSISSSSSFSSSSSDSISDSSLVAVAPASGAPAIKNPDLNRKIWKAYSEAYLVRYHKDPVRNAKVNGQVAQLGSRLGEEAPDVAAFYLTANKTFYVAKCHEFGLCLSDAEALHTQWFHGKAITNSDLKRFEKNVESASLDQLINEGKI